MSDAGTSLTPQAGSAGPPVLELRGVSKVYGDGPAEVHALHQANLSVQAGSMVAVMGPSGSGKSTLLTIAGSLEDPTSGEVLVGGVPLSGMSRGEKARLRRRTIGYVFQDFNLLPGLTAAENVALPLELDGVPARRARGAGLRALAGLGLAGRADRYPDQLSGGERQRVAIARAVAGERRLLLADEPSGALDSANGEAVIGLIRAACRRGMAAVVVTHDAHLASLADRVMYLHDGQLADQTVPGRGQQPLLETTGEPMPTSVRERPAQARSARADGGTPARRAVTRWAWRLFRREWRQQLLVLSLITVAVAGTVLGAAVASNTPPSPAAATFGTANHLAMIPGGQPHLAADIAAIRLRFGPVDVIENQNLVTGSASPVQLRAQNPAGPYGQPMLALVSGHYPSGPGQVALTRQVAALYNIQVGGIWRQGGRARRVVGIVENPGNLTDEFALVAPGQVSAPAEVTVLFDATPAGAATFRFPPGAAVQTPPGPSGGISPAFIVLAAATLGLIFVGLVAVASFTVLARRRLRALGMLGSLGAADRSIALVLTANGAITGTTGAIVGALAGFAAWSAYRPHLEISAGHRIGVLQLPWPVIGTGMVFAALTSILASRRPARAAARMSVQAALAGRPEPPKAARRSALPGVILLLAGPVLLVASGGWGHNGGTATLETLGGMTATIVGGLLLAPFCLTGLAALAGRAPVAVRLALRDLSRYRARSAAALSAISFAVLLAVLIGILATARYANALDYTGPNLAANQLLLYPPGHTSGPRAAPHAPPRGIRDLPPRLAAALGARDILTLDSATRPGARIVTPSGQDLGVATATLNQAGTQTNNYSGPLYVATPTLLRYFGISPSQISPGADVLTMRSGLAAEPRMQLALPPGSPGPGQSPSPDACPASRCIANPEIQTITGLPAGTSAPNTVITAHAMHVLGLHPVTSGWLFQTSQPLTAAQINTARQLATAADATIETRSGEVSLSQILSGATAVGILIALGVLAMTVGLIRSETATDLRTLTATGAGATTRRNLTAVTAGALGLLGALTGTALAYLTAISWFGHPSVIAATAPATELALILAGLPMAAAIGGWLFAGRQPPAIARQPLE